MNEKRKENKQQPKKRTSNNNNKDRFSQKKNDASWYYPNDLIGEAVADIPFSIFPGVEAPALDYSMPGEFSLTNASPDVNLGLMRFTYRPAFGSSQSPSSGLNMAAKALYTFVRHQNSGSKNYEAPDLMMYIMAMDQLYTMYFEGLRAYATAMTYSVYNKGLPELVLKAAGFNPSSMRNNLAQFRAGLNLFAAKLSSFAVPNLFKIFRRREHLAYNLFTDSSSPRGQYYLFKSQGYYRFDATTYQYGTGLTFFTRDDNQSPQDYLDYINLFLSEVMQDEDFNVMSGDILKAYGRENLYNVNGCSSDLTLSIVFDENMLNQIENLRFWNLETENTLESISNSVTQNQDGTILTVSGPIDMESFSNPSPGNVPCIINGHKDNPDWRDVFEWTQLTAGYITSNSNGTFTVEFSSELVVGMDICLYHQANLTVVPYDGTYISYPIEGPSSINHAEVIQLFRSIVWIGQFDWHPFLYIFSNDGVENLYYYGFNGDLKVGAKVSEEMLKLRHDTSILSLYGVDATAAKSLT